MPSSVHDAIIQEARRWIGTRFAHQGRRRASQQDAGGVDCLGLLIGVADALTLRDKHGELLSRYDRRDYPKSPDGSTLQQALDRALVRTTISQPGMIALFSLERNPQHLGILSDYREGGLGLIHAYAPARKVVEHALDDSWRSRMVGCYCVNSPTCKTDLCGADTRNARPQNRSVRQSTCHRRWQ